MRRTSASLAAGLALCLVVVGCSGTTELDPEPTGPTPPPPPIASIAEQDGAPILIEGEHTSELAYASGAAYFASAYAAVLAPADDEAAIARAGSLAIAIGVPLLPTGAEGQGSALESELVRLSTRSIITVGAVDTGAFDVSGLDVVPAPDDVAELAELLGVHLTAVSPESDGSNEDASNDAANDDAANDDAANDDAPDDAASDDEDSGSSGDSDEGTDDAGEGSSDDASSGDASSGDDRSDDDGSDDGGSNGGGAQGSQSAGAGTYIADLATIQPGQIIDVAPQSDETPEEVGSLSPTLPTERLDGPVLLADGAGEQEAAIATARAAGARVVLTDSISDAPPVIEELSGVEAIAALGEGFGPADEFAWRASSAATGVQLPGGGQNVLSGKSYIALYGHPETEALGVLGEQGPQESAELAQTYANPYEALTDDEVIPAMEIITTVATAGPGTDGTYSNLWEPQTFIPLIEAAQEAGQYVVLDFQPGRSTFTEQIEQYEELLAYPHVGVALDPEWRLEDDQVHLEQIGTVTAEEVNEVIDYLAEFAVSNDLPEKMLILHQFQQRMISDRQDLAIDTPQVAVVIHADGEGTPAQKLQTWRTLQEDAPEGVAWGWKNFIDEDDPMMSPDETYDVDPRPVFVSYQ